MDLYHNHIVDKLIKNIGINRTNLFNITIIESKRKFLTEINGLLEEGRIKMDYVPGPDRFRYSPKVLKLYEYEKDYGIKTAVFQLFYFPTSILEKELGFIRKGDEPEDTLEFALQITGYKLTEKDKLFFESHNEIKLNFHKFDYYLKAEYLNPYEEPYAYHQSNINILYVDNDHLFAINFIKNLKKVYLPDSNWHFFTNTAQAMFFLETKLEIWDPIDLIITGNNANLNGIEFVQAIDELKKEFEEKQIYFDIPIMTLTKNSGENGLINRHSGTENRVFHFSKSDDLYIIGNVVKTICSNMPY